MKKCTFQHCCILANIVYVVIFCMAPQVRNEPKNISICAEYIAKVKGVPLEKVMDVTTQNALRLFPRLKTFLTI